LPLHIPLSIEIDETENPHCPKRRENSTAVLRGRERPYRCEPRGFLGTASGDSPRARNLSRGSSQRHGRRPDRADRCKRRLAVLADLGAVSARFVSIIRGSMP